MSIIVRGARKLDADGIIDDFWFAASADRITATGTGDGWRAVEASDPTAAVTDAEGRWLTPGFIDLHGHGGGGTDFDHDLDGIRTALAVHRAHGTTRSVLSLVTNPVDSLIDSLGIIAELADADPLVLGSHLEGPFLADSHRGAHDPELLIDADAAVVAALLGAARGTLRQVTIAPELPGGLDAIEAFRAAGVVVAIGHTAASFEQAQTAFDRGATLVTHAFNALPGIHHRQPGPIVAAFGDQRVTLELILDGVHVRPEVAALAFAAAPGRIALITDAMAAAGSVDGHYELGSLDVTVTDGVARLTAGGSIAGSTLTMDRALKNAVELVGLDPVAAVAALTLTPARVLGLDADLGLLAEGRAADAVLLDAAFAVQQVWANGVAL
ncbi:MULTISPECIES: N-acetylglucosamine-6-phosphate deacetylase [unclassified Leifsonia]|uniref:N-acetylglucosamine-6-phosphate deacetylase n=1 Tax=unclassified Leifsonia TaxID=2663824 RepID=UPI000701C223|nr:MULTISPECIES: N-acetylglucosamine-6-phosphate deacetylase [unclassified Leifsonia]KQX07847.1 N-acetylglucosamine-6-phosphate deacetylase [Leifsonia sp. Root1293]KRA12128.1 N-acetylglucosamine-6-phosphate deacetylase [Leifsonia sp. Root60]